MQEHEVIQRIQALCEARSWSSYRLAKESGITYSTLCTMLHKANAPSLPTLIKICNGFGITLSQFFDDNECCTVISEAEEAHLLRWRRLSEEDRKSVDRFLDYLLSDTHS